jgi:tol-pal system protein YbgF
MIHIKGLQLAVMGLLILSTGCASKQYQQQIQQLKTEKAKLAQEKDNLQRDLAALSEENIILKGRIAAGPEASAWAQPVQKQTATAPVAREDPNVKPFIEEDVEADLPTLVITNKELEAGPWSNPAPKTVVKPSKTNVKSALVQEYELAYQKFTQQKTNESRALFVAFIQNHPQTSYTDNAYFWLGETYYQKKDYPSALVNYQKVIELFPNENKVPDAMLRSSVCLLKMSKSQEAKASLEKLIREYPKSEAARKAKASLRNIP